MDEETRRELAALVAPARKERRWSQEELADKANVSRGAVSSIERGTALPQPAVITAVLNALEVTTEGQRRLGDEWSPAVRVVLDMVGLYLESFEPPELEEEIRAITLAVLDRNLGRQPRHNGEPEPAT